MNINIQGPADRALYEFMNPQDVAQAARQATLEAVKNLSQAQRKLLITVLKDNKSKGKYDVAALTKLKAQLEMSSTSKKTVTARMKRAFDTFCETMRYGYDRINSDELMSAIKTNEQKSMERLASAHADYLAQNNLNARTFAQGKLVMKEILGGYRSLMCQKYPLTAGVLAKVQVRDRITELVSGSAFSKLPDGVAKQDELYRLWMLGCGIFQEKLPRELSEQDKCDVMELLVLSSDMPFSFVDAAGTPTASEQSVQEMMKVVVQAAVNIANADKALPKKLRSALLKFEYEQKNVTEATLQHVRETLKLQMETISSGQVKPEANPWGLPASVAKFYLSEEFQKIVRGKDRVFDGLSTNEEKLVFIKELNDDIRAPYRDYILLEKKRGVDDKELLGGGEGNEVMTLIVLELNIPPAFLLFEAELSDKLSVDAYRMRQISVCMEKLCQVM